MNYSIFIHGGIYVLSIVYLGCNVQENEFCLKTLFVCESRDVHKTFSAETRRDVVSPRRYKLPRRLVKSSKQSPQVAAYRDN